MPEVAARRIMVFLTEDDRYGHHSVAEELLRRARELGVAGGTLWRAVEGFGPSGHLRAARLPDLARGLPLVVEVIDHEPGAERFLSIVEELAPGVLVTSEGVEVSRSTAPAS